MNAASALRLGDLCDLVSLQVDPAAIPSAVYIGLEHVAPGRFWISQHGLAQEAQSSKFKFAEGDVLYGKLRPYLDKAVIAPSAGVCTTELLVLRPRSNVPSTYLAAVVHTPGFTEHAMSGVTGAHHPRTSWRHISEFELHEHSVDQRQKIGNLLSQLQRLIACVEAQATTALEIKSGAMDALFSRGLHGEAQKESEVGLIPDSWRVEPLAAHFAVCSGGTPSRGSSQYWEAGEVPWVKTTEVNYCVIRDTEEKITALGLADSAAKLLPAGTVLMAMYGQGVTRGKVAILGLEAACNQACAAMIATDGAVDHKYLYHFLTWRYEAIRQLAHGGQQQNLNLDIVRALPIAYPVDPEEQRQVCTALDAIDAKIALHQQKRAVLEELFKALLHKLMTGEIDVNDLDLSALQPAT
jgi:type I restriction enzyme S subunit